MGAGATPHETASIALAQAAAGNTVGAFGLFVRNNFPNPKQEEFIREAYIEVRLLYLVDLASSGRCPEANRLLANVGGEDQNLPFTFGSFANFVKGARFQYLLGVAEFHCVDEGAARKRWDRVAKLRPAPDSPDYPWPYAALATIGRPPAAPPLDATPLAYNRGLLLMVEGHYDQAEPVLREALDANPPELLRHLIDDALRNGIRK